jgi:hypothetical protein
MFEKMVVIPEEQFKEELAMRVASILLAKLSGTTPPPPKDDFLTTDEVLAVLRISAPTLRKLRKTGHLKTYGEGTRFQRYKRSEVETALANYK